MKKLIRRSPYDEAVKNKHSGNKYEKQYMAAIEFIKTVLMVDDNGDKIEDEIKN